MLAPYAPPPHQQNYWPAFEAVLIGEHETPFGGLGPVGCLFADSQAPDAALDLKALAIFDDFWLHESVAGMPEMISLPIQ